MGSRRDPSGSEQCLNTIRDKQKRLQEIPFRTNYIGVQQALDDVRTESEDVQGLKRKVEDIRKIRGHTNDFQTLEKEHIQAEDLSLQKKRCLETLLYVNEVENLYQNVQTEFEDRAIYLSERKEVFESIYREDSMEASARMHRDCVYALRNSWSWLSEMTKCLDTHLHNAADYHQFFHDIQFLDQDMHNFLSWMGSEHMRAKVETQEPEVLMRHLRHVTNTLLDYQNRVERLGERSKHIHPIQLRKELPGYPIKAKALVNYEHKEVSLKVDEICTVLDNSDNDRWQIRALDGREAEVPGIILVIPPPDQKGFVEVQRIKEQMSVHWDSTIKRIRTQLTQFLSTSMESTPGRDLFNITASQKADLMRLVNEAVHLLRPASTDDPEFKDFVVQVTDFRKTLSQVKPGPREIKNQTTQKWKSNTKVVNLYKELLTYGKTFKQTIASSGSQEKLFIRDPEEVQIFSSKAYFERALPVVDIDSMTKETRSTKIKAGLYIHERLRGKRPTPPPRKKRQLKRPLSALADSESVSDMPSDVTEETKSFVITGIVDPKTKQELSVFQALSKGILDKVHGTYTNPETQETMSIPEAIQRGLIHVDFRENLANGGHSENGFDHMKNTLDTKVFSIAGVIDPRTGEWIGVKEAITSGIIDPKSGKFRNLVTGEEMSIMDAVQNGYLVADPSLLEEGTQDNGTHTFVDFTDVSYQISGVIDPSTGEEISLKRAIMDGIVDPTNSVYRNPHTGETMAVSDAIKQGLLKGRSIDPSTSGRKDDVLTFKELQIKKQRFSSGDSDSDGQDVMESRRKDPNQIMFEKIKTKTDPTKRAITDLTDHSCLSLEEAFSKGMVNFAKNEFTTPSGEVLSLQEAVTRNLIEPDVMEDVLNVYKDASLGELVAAGKFDPETGLVSDPTTGHTLSLQAAIAQRIIDPSMVYFYDVPSQKITSLAEAIENGRYDPATGKYINPRTGEGMTLTEAEKLNLIYTNIDPSRISDSAETLSKLRKAMETNVPSVKTAYSDDPVSLDDAIKAGFIDVQEGKFTDPITGEELPLGAAIRAQKIDNAAASALIEALNRLSLQEAVREGQLDLETGKFVDPDTAEVKTVKQAIDQGLFNPNTVYLVDKANDNITSLGALIEAGKFDPVTGLFHDPVSGQTMTLADAVERGLIEAAIEPAKFIDSSATLKDLIDNNKVNPRSTTFVAPNGHKMSLRDALAHGLLTMNSNVKIDPDSGNVILSSDEDVVNALVDIKESVDWLNNVEQTLASQGKPSERVEKLKTQSGETKALEEDIDNHGPRVRSSIKQAEELIETNKTEQKEDSAQQYQKLRYNTSDLKVRFDTAQTEAGQRCKRLVVMCEDLENFYTQLQDLDQWLDQAIEKSEDLQTSKDAIETQYEIFKEFVDELRAKDEDLGKVSKMADKFRDAAHDFESDVDSYRKRISRLPAIKEEADADVIDDEIEGLESKYKDISRDCAKHMEKLANLMKVKRTYDDLSEKLSTAYPQIERGVQDVREDGIGRNPDKDAKDLDRLKDVKADLIGQERRLKDLALAGEKLSACLVDMNMKKRSDEVKKTVNDQKNKHKALADDISNKEGLLDAAVSQQHNVMKRLDGLIDWMADTEKSLNKTEPISLDKEKLAVQLKEQRLLNAELSSSKALLDRLSGEASDASREDAEATIFDLSERLEVCERKADSKTKELEDVLANITELESNNAVMDGWLSEAVSSMKSRPKGSNQKTTKAKVDSLYNEKREKEFDMENLRNACKRILEDDRVCDQYATKECLGEVEAKWHELTELLVQQVSLEALTEIDGMLKYLDKAENEINTAEPISIDPETLSVQLREHNAFNADLNGKRNSVKDIIDKCNRMLRETTNTQTDEIKSRLDSIKTQADIVCQLSSERQQQLEAALPLATHFSENQSEISGWLDEMEAEIKAQGTPGDNLEQIRKQYDNLKATLQRIEDHKPFVEDLNSTGLELMELCGDEDAGDIQNKLYNVGARYEQLKKQARVKSRELSDARRDKTQEVSESLDNLLDDVAQMNRTVTNADPIPASPDKLKDEIEENKSVLMELERQFPHIKKAEEMARKLLATGIDDPSEAEDIRNKITEIATLNNQTRESGLQRERALTETLGVADKFCDLCGDVMSNLRDLKDNLLSQEPPGVDAATIKEQQKELKEFRKELGKARLSLDECRQSGEHLSALVGEPGLIEIRKQLEDIHNLADDVHDINRDREEDLRNALNHAEKYQELLDSATSWLPITDHKLANMRPVSSKPEVLKQQIEELKLFKAQTHPHVVEMQQLNQQLAALKDISPVAAESLQKPVLESMDKWNEILRGIGDREAQLSEMQAKTGEVEEALDDMLGVLDQAQETLATFDDVAGDPKCLETQMKKLQLLQSDLKGQEQTCRKLSDVADNLAASAEDGCPALKEKRDAVNDLMRSVQANARDKEARLHENLRQMKRFLGDVDDMLQWVNETRLELKSAPPIGALPETAQDQYEAFQKRHEDLESREDPTRALLAKGQELVDKCRPEDAVGIADKLRKLKERWGDTKERAQKRKEKLEEHLHNVGEFHGTLKTFTDWLNNAEITMRGFKYPSKIVEKVVKQIAEHNGLKSELEQQIDKMQGLDRTGTYLKYFGRKQDTIYIKNLLVGIRLRWKKLLRRTDERGRVLQQAQKEDKRFYDAWKGLCDWLDDSARTMSRFMTPGQQNNASKQDIDELKRFQHQLAGKHPAFYSTTRLGRNLKDRCTKADPDREILQQMLDELKNKWNSVRSVVSKSQNKLDEALLTSGRAVDALSSLQEWLNKAESTLAEDQPILGDLDTIHMLIEQHKSMQQELAAREQTVAAMKASGDIPASQLEELNSLWEGVNRLSDIRETKLKESLQLGEEFQDVVTVMREFLPQAEAELKYKALPDDEVAIIQLIEKHEKFQEDLRNHQDCVDKIKNLAEEILMNCHPNAVRFVKYYLTITQTRWDQLLQRAKTRATRLQEALRNIQGNAALVEELLSLLTDAQVLLATKEKDPVPEDLKVVEELFREHLDFHEDINSKNGDVERLTKIVNNEARIAQGRQFGSNMKLNDFDSHNPRLIALQNKWRVVWRMSLDRKKKLQDSLDTLVELESFKNFDFELWKQKYLNWIQVKKFRITDFFRRQDKDGDGYLSREEFLAGMLQSRFPTNRTELNAVFDIFDRDNWGNIAYKEFIEALKPERHQKSRLKSGKRQMTDAELVHEEIEREISGCQCRNSFKAERMEECKYRFGEKRVTRLVRFLNGTVMVRVGGGWVTLDEFLEQNDPCKAKGRTNIELRETLLSPDGANYSNSIRPRTASTGARARHNDTGYASSSSSAGSSGDTSLRRSRVTSSMVNLSGPGASSPMRKNSDFGSTGSLTRSKRLSNSSSSLTTPTKTRTASASSARDNSYSSPRTPPYGSRSATSTPTFAGRSKTPTPRSSTPKATSTPKAATPNRSGRTTPQPSSGRTTPTFSGRTTPTMSNGPYSGRRLPTTPKSSR